MKKSDENIPENTAEEVFEENTAEEILEETMTEITECEPTETTEETESDVNDKNISFKEIKLPIIQITVILMLIASGFILYYILGPARCEFHSDCTDTLMWAQASYDSGKVFDPNFSYAALLPFSTGLIMQLFIGITGVSYTTHAIGMIGFFILFSLALIFMLRSSGFGFGECFFIHFLLMFLFSGSKKLREIFWGHTIYYSLGLLFLFTGLALLFGIINDLKNKKTGRAFAVKAVSLGALCILSSLNGIQALTIFILPMTGAVIGYAFLNFEEKLLSKENIELVMIAMFVLICAGIGLAVGSLLAKGITSGYEEGYSKFSSSKKWAENAGKQFVNWLTLAGVNVTEDDKITSIKSMKSIVIIFFNLLAAVIPVYRIFTYERIKRWQTKIFFIVHWACASLILIGCIFGKIGSANWRLTPIMGTAYIFFFMFVKELIEDKKYSRLGVFFVLPVLICAIGSMVGIAQLDTDLDKSENGKKIMAIKESGAAYGYATFWNAHAVTVLSGEKICARNVVIKKGKLEKRLYQSQKRWFADQPNVENYFLLLTEDEYDELAKSDPELISSAYKTYHRKEYYVLLYDHNLF